MRDHSRHGSRHLHRSLRTRLRARLRGVRHHAGGRRREGREAWCISPRCAAPACGTSRRRPIRRPGTKRRRPDAAPGTPNGHHDPHPAARRDAARHRVRGARRLEPRAARRRLLPCGGPRRLPGRGASGAGGRLHRRGLVCGALRLHRPVHRGAGLARARHRAPALGQGHGAAGGPGGRARRRAGAAGQLPQERLLAGMAEHPLCRRGPARRAHAGRADRARSARSTSRRCAPTTAASFPRRATPSCAPGSRCPMRRAWPGSSKAGSADGA